MAKTTVCYGVVLILLGIFGFVATGHHAPTALIPAFVGLILAILGFLAITEDAKKRMLFMHIAVTVGLLGFLSTTPYVYKYIRMLQGWQYPRPRAIEEATAMSVLLLIFVIFCVRSFIAARRARA